MSGARVWNGDFTGVRADTGDLQAQTPACVSAAPTCARAEMPPADGSARRPKENRLRTGIQAASEIFVADLREDSAREPRNRRGESMAPAPGLSSDNPLPDFQIPENVCAFHCFG